MLGYLIQKAVSVHVHYFFGLKELLSKTITTLNFHRLTHEINLKSTPTSTLRKIKNTQILNSDGSISIASKPKHFKSYLTENRLVEPIRLRPGCNFLCINHAWRLNGDGIKMVLSNFKQRWSPMNLLSKNYSHRSENILAQVPAPKIFQPLWVHIPLYQRQSFWNELFVVPSGKYSTQKSKPCGVKESMTSGKEQKQRKHQRVPLYQKKIFPNTVPAKDRAEPRKTVRAYPKFPDDSTMCNSLKSQSIECATEKSSKKGCSPQAIKKTLKESGQPPLGPSSVCKAVACPEADGSNLPYLVKMKECKDTKSTSNGCSNGHGFSKSNKSANCIVEFKDKCEKNLTLPRKSKKRVTAEMNCFGACSYSKPKDPFTMKDLDNCHPNTAALKYRLAKLPKIDEMWCCPKEVKIPLPPKPLPRKVPCSKPLKRRRKCPKFVATGEWKKQKFVFRHRIYKCPPRIPKDQRGPVCPPIPEEIRCDHCAPPPVATLVTDICATDIRPKMKRCPPKRRPPKLNRDDCCRPATSDCDVIKTKNYATKMEESRPLKPKSNN